MCNSMLLFEHAKVGGTGVPLQSQDVWMSNVFESKHHQTQAFFLLGPSDEAMDYCTQPTTSGQPE